MRGGGSSLDPDAGLAMKVGLVGFAGSGKSTVFEWLTGVKSDPAKAQLGQTGVARVPDPRLAWLAEKFQPKKTTYTALDFFDTPGLMPTERRDNPRRLGIQREANGLLVVLNGYSETNWVDELVRFRQELVFADLEIVTGRIARLEVQGKKAKPAKEKEADQFELHLLQRIVTALESEQPLASLGLKPDEEKAVRSFQLLTLKPEQVLVNVGDSQLQGSLPPALLALAPNALKAPPKLELELLDLAEDERQMFMQEMGLPGFVRDDVLRAIFASMGQIVFFTVGYDECRSWGMPKGADAVVGAGQIHTDLARGFVRAQVVSYADFEKLYASTRGRVNESMPEARAQGVLRQEGKAYVVQDGDIMHILHTT
jgi:ribosome-binding ATPase YchF (GTP1/OBG family)